MYTMINVNRIIIFYSVSPYIPCQCIQNTQQWLLLPPIPPLFWPIHGKWYSSPDRSDRTRISCHLSGVWTLQKMGIIWTWPTIYGKSYEPQMVSIVMAIPCSVGMVYGKSPKQMVSGWLWKPPEWFNDGKWETPDRWRCSKPLLLDDGD